MLLYLAKDYWCSYVLGCLVKIYVLMILWCSATCYQKESLIVLLMQWLGKLQTSADLNHAESDEQFVSLPTWTKKCKIERKRWNGPNNKLLLLQGLPHIASPLRHSHTRMSESLLQQGNTTSNAYHEGAFAAESSFAYEALIGVGYHSVHVFDELFQVCVLRLLYLHIFLHTVIAEISNDRLIRWG